MKGKLHLHAVPPALPWAVGVVSGVLAVHAWVVPVWALACLVIAALTWPRTPRSAAVLALLVGLGVGGLAARGAPREDSLVRLDPGRPVEAVGRVVEDPWPDGGGGLRCRLRFDQVRQGGWVGGRGAVVVLRVPAEASAEVQRGARLRTRGYLKRSAPPRNLRGVPPGPWRLQVASVRFVHLEEAPPVWTRWALRLRSTLAGALERWPDEPAAALAAALWLGDRTGLPGRWQRALRAWGMAHLIAISGLHLGLVALLAYAAGLWLPRRPRLLWLGLAVLAYAWLAGPRPSVIRAAVMASIAVMALLAERPPQGLNALAVAAAALVLVQPATALDLGFRLSVAATAGLLLLSLPVAQALGGEGKSGAGGRPGWLSLGLASTIAAQLAVAPVAWPTFALVQPLAPFLNLLAVPWLSAALVSSAAGVAVTLLLPAASAWAGKPTAFCAFLLERLAEAAPSPWVCRPVAIGPWGAAAVSALLLALLLGWRRWRPEALAVGSSAVALGVLAAVLSGVGTEVTMGRGEAGATSATSFAEVVALDVGQGDALLLRSSDGGAVLVDGGGWRRGDVAARVLVPALADLGVSHLRAVVMSHPDTDHCSGLVDLASYLPIDEVWSSPGWRHPCAVELLGRAGVRWRPLWQGRRALEGVWSFEVLWPPARRSSGGAGPSVGIGAVTQAANDRSLVLKASALGRRLLLTGDIGEAVERQLASRHGGALDVDLLKVAHHGSKSSSSAALLDAVSPKLALIQAGRGNFYGHPHPSVLTRLARRGIRVLRTDHHGLVRLRWRRAGAFEIHTSASPP